MRGQSEQGCATGVRFVVAEKRVSRLSGDRSLQKAQTPNVGWPEAIEYYRQVTPLAEQQEAERRRRDREWRRGRPRRIIWSVLRGLPRYVIHRAKIYIRLWRELRGRRVIGRE